MSTPASFLENLFGLSGRTAVVVGGTGVLGGAFADGRPVPSWWWPAGGSIGVRPG